MKHQLSSIPNIARWLWHKMHGLHIQATLNTITGLLLVGLDLLFVWLTKLTVDIATGHSDGTISLTLAVVLLVAVMISQIALGISNRWIRAILGVRAQNVMQERFFARLLSAEWRGLKRYHSGDLLNRMMRDVSDIVTFLTESLPSLICTIVQFVGAFVFLFWMNRKLALVVVVVLPIFAVLSRLYIRQMRDISHEVRDLDGKVQSMMQETVQHALVVKTLGRVGYMVSGLTNLHENLRAKVRRRTIYSSVSSGLMNIGFGAGYMITFVWGIVSLRDGVITYGALIAFIQLIGQIQSPVRQLTRFIPVFIGAFTATERLMEMEEIPVEDTREEDESPVDMNSHYGLSIKGLTFRYDNNSRDIYHDFHHEFTPGSVTAILGETGSGKTTLIRLILRLIHPVSGHISLTDGTQEIPVTATSRCAFGYVPQGNTLLSGTIRDNLRLGKPDATEAELREVLHVAAADFVYDLPSGLDTPCTEMGGGLSEGQAQRLTIARALLRTCPILIFDESTAALDPDTEQTVVQRIVQYAKGRTVIFVTHRPAVIPFCTEVMRL